jgi:ribosome-associated protein
MLSTLLETLSQHKAKDVQVLDVHSQTPWADVFVVCTATSDRHAKSMATALIQMAKSQKITPIGVEGFNLGEWVLISLGAIVVHIMLADKREFYQLEQLWLDAKAAPLNYDQYLFGEAALEVHQI